MQGFKSVAMTDHEFAKYLRKHHAIDTYSAVGKSNQWRDPKGRIVAVAIYSGAADRTIYVPVWEPTE